MPHLHRTEQDPRPVVVMTCGIAGTPSPSQSSHAHGLTPPGAGKSTLSKAIVASLSAFTRLSVDTINREVHGLYKIDYPAEQYDDNLDKSQGVVKERLHGLLVSGQDVVLDLSFYNREYRDEYKELIERDGGRWVLVFLEAERELLWRRIGERRARRDALSVGERDGDSAFDIDEDVFDMYWSCFERPQGEGEVVVKVV